MSALPSDIAKYTTDGFLLTQANQTTKTTYPNSIDGGTSELEMFFDDPASAVVLLAERFAIIGMVNRVHEAVEVDDSLGLGTTLPITPSVPQFQLIDDSRSMNARTALRAYSFDMGSDRYAMELVGIIGRLVAPWTADGTGQPTADNTSRSADEL